MNKRLLFFHIMKTAGTTLTAFLDQHFDQNRIFPHQHWYELDSFAGENLGDFDLYRGHYNFEQIGSIPESLCLITVLRHPVNRIVSEYEHWHRDSEEFAIENPAYGQIYRLAKRCSLDKFLANEHLSGFFVSNRQTYQLGLGRSMPRSAEILDPQLVLDSAKERLRNFQVVGIAEDIQRTIHILCGNFGWYPPQHMPRLRVFGSSLMKVLSTGVHNTLREVTNLDSELYNYAKKMFEERYSVMIQELHHRIKTEYRDESLATDTHHALELNYIRSFNLKHPVGKSEYCLNFDKAFDGDGWHIREMDQGITWRYTASAYSFIDLPLAWNKNLSITIHVPRVSGWERKTNVKFSINGVYLDHELAADERVDYYVLHTKQRIFSLSPGRARLGIHIGRTQIVSDRYPGSYREIGIPVTQIEVKPMKGRFWFLNFRKG